jgi:hypothetical protein
MNFISKFNAINPSPYSPIWWPRAFPIIPTTNNLIMVWRACAFFDKRLSSPGFQWLFRAKSEIVSLQVFHPTITKLAFLYQSLQSSI